MSKPLLSAAGTSCQVTFPAASSGVPGKPFGRANTLMRVRNANCSVLTSAFFAVFGGTSSTFSQKHGLLVLRQRVAGVHHPDRLRLLGVHAEDRRWQHGGGRCVGGPRIR